MINWRPGSLTQRRVSRRAALRAGGLGVAATFVGESLRSVSAQEATPTAAIGEGAAEDGLAVEVIELFDALPGTKGLKFWAPPDAGRPKWSAAVNADRELVIASAFKAFVLAEYLRQVEDTLDPTAAAPLAAQLGEQMQEELALDESVFTLGSPIFNPPNLTGKVTARTTLQAMILESDDTAADMMLKRIGPQAGARAHCRPGFAADPDSGQHSPVHRLRVWRPRLAHPHLGAAPAAGGEHARTRRASLSTTRSLWPVARTTSSASMRAPCRGALPLPRDSLRLPHHALLEGRDRPDFSTRGQLVCQRGQPRRVLGPRALCRRWHVRGAALGLLRGDPQLVR